MLFWLNFLKNKSLTRSSLKLSKCSLMRSLSWAVRQEKIVLKSWASTYQQHLTKKSTSKFWVSSVDKWPKKTSTANWSKTLFVKSICKKEVSEHAGSALWSKFQSLLKKMKLLGRQSRSLSLTQAMKSRPDWKFNHSLKSINSANMNSIWLKITWISTADKSKRQTTNPF